MAPFQDCPPGELPIARLLGLLVVSVCGQLAAAGSAWMQSGVNVHVVVARMIRDIRDDRDLRRTSRSAAFVEVGEESEHYRAIYSRASPVTVCGDRFLALLVFQLPTEYSRAQVDR